VSVSFLTAFASAAFAGSYPAYPYVNNDEALSQSIFVKDLPQDISAQRLAEEFARFGPLRNGVRGVNLKVRRQGGCTTHLFVCSVVLH